MAEHILLVFEGEKTERQIYNNLINYFLNESPNTIIFGLFGSHIYSLYHILQKDPDLELFNLLKEDRKNSDRLKHVDRNDVSQIFLFFDYDGHDPTATDDKLTDMLSYFDEETENGKLYISYPMVEAIKHIQSDLDFEHITVPAKKDIAYKSFVHDKCDCQYRDLTALTLSQWNHLIKLHCKKMNLIVNDAFELPNEYITQSLVFINQKSKYIDPFGQVAVLSAFPVFIVDYYGCKFLPIILGRSE